MLESVQMNMTLVSNAGDWNRQSVVMVVDNEFQSQPCLTIQYTIDEILEGSSSCELLESTQTGEKWDWPS